MGSFWQSTYASQAQGRRNLRTHHHLDSLGQMSIQGRSIWEEKNLDLHTHDFWCCNLCQAPFLAVFWKALVSSLGCFFLLLLPLSCIWPCFCLFQGMTECRFFRVANLGCKIHKVPLHLLVYKSFTSVCVAPFTCRTDVKFHLQQSCF